MVVATAVATFVVKNGVRELEAELLTLGNAISEDREAIEVLQAEWAFLNQPAALEERGRQLLGLVAPSAKQILPIDAFLAGGGLERATPSGAQRMSMGSP